MLILALTVNELIWIGFAGSLVATIICIYRYFVTRSSGQSGGSESSLDGY
jgi:hypothetical protein